MRLVPFLRKRKQNADTVTATQEPDPGDTCIVKDSKDADSKDNKDDVNANLPKVGTGVFVREDYFTYRDAGNVRNNDIRQSSSVSRLVVAVHERARQKSRSFADLRSFTDEYIQHKHIFMNGGGIGGAAACPSYTAYPRLSVTRSSAGSSTSGDSTGSSTLAVSMNSSMESIPAFCKMERTASGTPIMTRADALRAFYAPIGDAQRLKQLRRPLKYAIENAINISPSVTLALKNARAECEKEENMARMFVRFALRSVRIPSLVREATTETEEDTQMHRYKQQSALGRSISSLSRFCLGTKFRFGGQSSSGQSSSTSSTEVIRPVEMRKPVQQRNRPPPVLPTTVYQDAVKTLERGRVPGQYVMPFPFPGSCYLAFPCPRLIRERTRQNGTQQTFNFFTLYAIIACEMFTLVRLVYNLDTLGGDDNVGPIYVLGATFVLFIAFCCTAMHLLSYWTQLEWARGNRNLALLFPKNSILV